MRHNVWRLVCAGAGLVAIAACGGGEGRGEGAASFAIVEEANRHIVVEVTAMPGNDGLRRVFDAVRAKDRPDGGYFVSINCSTGGTEMVDNRLANGKFAVGRLGAAQTGLPEGGTEFKLLPEAKCPAESPTALAGAGSKIPRPDAEQAAEFLATMKGIDADLVTKRDRAISRARNLCDRILNRPDSRYSVRRVARLEFEGPDVDLTDRQVGRIVAAVKVWCHR